MDALLTVDGVTAGYGAGTVLEDVSLRVEEHSTVGLLGRNGVGKTTTLRTVAGILTPREGTVTFASTDVTGDQPHEIYRRGVAMVPEDRGIFPDLTVRENLRVPIVTDAERERSIDDLYEFFPTLERIQHSKGKHLSGGEQQMLTIARVLRADPRLLLLDEPSEGLAPQIVEDVKSVIETIGDEGTTILLVEQNVEMVREVASYFYVMDAGHVVFEGDDAAMDEQEAEVERFLGIHGDLDA